MTQTLLDTEKGKEVKIVGSMGGQELQRKMESLNIRKGKHVKKVATQPLNGPVVISVDGQQIAIGRGICSKIHVEEL